jgi:pSer/pThr/pTyr-binding forkhead associated (FHA) protein
MKHMRVKVTLTVIEGEDYEKTQQVNKTPYVLGRAKADFAISDGKVSGTHAQINVEGKKVWLEDLNSRNGTVVNGVEITKRQLRDLDVLELGFTKIQVNIVDNLQALKDMTSVDEQTDLSKDIGTLIEDELDKFSKWDLSNPGSKLRDDHGHMPMGLKVIKGPDKGKVFYFPQKKIVMGRGQVDLLLKDSETSRTHAQIDVLENGQVVVKDLDSTNGTWFRGERIQEQILEPGDYFQIGHTVCQLFVDPPE